VADPSISCVLPQLLEFGSSPEIPTVASTSLFLSLSLSLSTDTDPIQLWPQKTKPENTTKPTKNCSLLINFFPAAKNQNPRKL
jgi:hypothetical protein